MELPTINTQKPEPQRVSDPDKVELVGQPWLTLQGEGPFAGRPAVFLRLAGCNLKCKACDTDYTTDRKFWDRGTLVRLAAGMAGAGRRKRLIVLTGGEPFRQPIAALLSGLVTAGLDVQVETNGSLWDADFPTWLGGRVSVVVSPKLEVNPNIWQVATAAKYVLKAEKVAADGLPTEALGYKVPPDRPPVGWPGRIFVQPEDDKDPELNALNRAAAVQSAVTHGYTLSLQLHKILGLP